MAILRTDEALTILSGIVKEAVEATPIVTLPKVEISQGTGDEEEIVLLLSDIQTGNRTPTSNMAILAERGEKLAQAVIKVTTLQRNAIPIKKLHVFIMGDMIQSEDIQTKIDLDALECVIMDQIFKGVVPIIEKLLLTLAPYFPKGIDCWCVPGNHGSLGRLNAVTTNWDTLVYKILESRLQNYSKIHWHIEAQKFYQVVNVMKHKFLIAHGDCIPRYLNIPIYGITQRAMRWQGSIGNFDYLCLAHFHTPLRMDWNNIEVVVNGTFMSDDQWALKVVGMSTEPAQVLFGVHPRKGISFYYKLKLNGNGK